MATKKIKGVVIPRHDTAINWAKATNFVPRDGELIVFTADNIPLEEISTNDAPIWTSYDDESNLIACDYNNRTDFTYVGSTQDLTVATMVDGCMVDGTSVPYMNLDENGTYVDSGSSFNLTPSAKTRFKFGNGKTNVNLLPFVETGSSENSSDVDLSNYYNKDETKAAIVEELNKYDSVALMEVTKSSDGLFLELEDIYPIQDDATLYMYGAANEPAQIYDHNLCGDIPLTSPTSFTNLSARILSISSPNNGIIDATLCNFSWYGPTVAISGNFVANEAVTTDTECEIGFTTSNGPLLCYFDGTKLVNGNTYEFVFDITGSVINSYGMNPSDAANAEDILVINRGYIIEIEAPNDSPYNHTTVITEADGKTLDASKLYYPYSLVTYGDVGCPYTYSATYDTEYKVDQHYNKDSAIPQSGTAVAEALDSLVTVMKGSSIDDITAAGVTSKVVILYED